MPHWLIQLVAALAALLNFLNPAPTLPASMVFASVPDPLPANVVSLGFQATRTAEFGDEIALAPGTPRLAGFATVTMSTWASHSQYPGFRKKGYVHPITLNVYADAASAVAGQPVATMTEDFVIPWRPEADPSCPGGTAWRDEDGDCYNGMAFNITFDLRPLKFELPDRFIYGVAFNTSAAGHAPLGTVGPYDALNLGLDVVDPTVGENVDLDTVYWNTSIAGYYPDGGLDGVSIFRSAGNWSPYTPAVSFAAYGVPESARDCKGGGWKALVRDDFTGFKNEGACVSYASRRR